jgi:hypothetical protein
MRLREMTFLVAAVASGGGDTLGKNKRSCGRAGNEDKKS